MYHISDKVFCLHDIGRSTELGIGSSGPWCQYQGTAGASELDFVGRWVIPRCSGYKEHRLTNCWEACTFSVLFLFWIILQSSSPSDKNSAYLIIKRRNNPQNVIIQSCGYPTVSRESVFIFKFKIKWKKQTTLNIKHVFCGSSPVYECERPMVKAEIW